MMKTAVTVLVCCLGLAVTAAAQPERIAADNVLTSSALPEIRVVLDEDLRYLGKHPFRIRDVAAGERYVFADVDSSQRVERLFVFQFEGFLPESDEIYRYSFQNAMVMRGHRFRQNVFAYSNRAAQENNPQGEGVLTRRFLEEQGLSVADALMMSRFVTVPDREKRHELILFYLEPLPDGVELVDLYEDDQPTEIWTRLGDELTRRSLQAFTIE